MAFSKPRPPPEVLFALPVEEQGRTSAGSAEKNLSKGETKKDESK